ncbi:MAG: hypothetical protein SGPRY_010641 [Prymnesium sp.]
MNQERVGWEGGRWGRRRRREGVGGGRRRGEQSLATGVVEEALRLSGAIYAKVLHQLRVPFVRHNARHVARLNGGDVGSHCFSNAPLVFCGADAAIDVHGFRAHPSADQLDEPIFDSRGVQRGGQPAAIRMPRVDGRRGGSEAVAQDHFQDAIQAGVRVRAALGGAKERWCGTVGWRTAYFELNIAQAHSGVTWLVVEGEDHWKGAVYLAELVWLLSRWGEAGEVVPGAERVQSCFGGRFDGDATDRS